MTKNKYWIGYIIIVALYVGISIVYPYFDLIYQRKLLFGRGEIPWGSLLLGASLILYYFFIEFNKNK